MRSRRPSLAQVPVLAVLVVIPVTAALAVSCVVALTLARAAYLREQTADQAHLLRTCYDVDDDEITARLELRLSERHPWLARFIDVRQCVNG